jgi:hypothetical protein
MKVLPTALVICAAALLCGLPLAALPDDSAPATGVWQKHEYRFSFVGFTTTYSCDGLADKLKLLLLAAGARKDAKSQPAACARGFGRPDKFASAYLTFYTLSAPGADQAGATAAAGSWRAVQFTPHKPSQLGIGDCELIEQFRDRLLPMFSVRNVEDKTTCVPHQISGSGFSLSFETLAAAEPGTGSTGRNTIPSPALSKG